MSRPSYFASQLLILVYVSLTLFISISASTDSPLYNNYGSKKASAIFQKFEKNPQLDHVNLLLSMTNGSVDPVLAPFDNSKVSPTWISRAHRRQLITSSLRSHAAASQKNVLNFLSVYSEESKNVPNSSTKSQIQVKSFWITNQILVRGVDRALLEKLEEHPEVSVIEEEAIARLSSAVDVVPNVFKRGSDHPDREVQWGVERIKAAAVWRMNYTGRGVVVANIDTGVMASHEALKDNFRRSHGWFDPIKGVTTPYDDNGHGTHIIGTICGKTRGIGVAPDAQFIACKAFSQDGFGELGDLIDCGQWAVCPNQIPGSGGEGEQECLDTPHIVTNSWNLPGGTKQYDQVINVWKFVDIIPIWSIGNEMEGPKCSSIQYPADSVEDVISVGSTGRGDALVCTSCVGPHSDPQVVAKGIFKPEVVAPGLSILSADWQDKQGYRHDSGTSMAAPHVAGLVALLLSKNPGWDYERVKQVVTSTAGQTVPTNMNCGGISESSYPNYHVGFGLVNCLNAILEKEREASPSSFSDPTRDFLTLVKGGKNSKVLRQQITDSSCDSSGNLFLPSVFRALFPIFVTVVVVATI